MREEQLNCPAWLVELTTPPLQPSTRSPARSRLEVRGRLFCVGYLIHGTHKKDLLTPASARLAHLNRCQEDIATSRYANKILCNPSVPDIERPSRRPIAPQLLDISLRWLWLVGADSQPGGEHRRGHTTTTTTKSHCLPRGTTTTPCSGLMPHCFASRRLVSVSESTRDLAPSLRGRHTR